MGSAAFFTGEQDEDGTPRLQGFGPVQAAMLNQLRLTWIITAINKKLGRQNMNETAEEAERALLAGIEYTGNPSPWSLEESLAELARLAETAGATVVGRFTQRRDKPDAALFLGKGKVEEIAMNVTLDIQRRIDIFNEGSAPDRPYPLQCHLIYDLYAPEMKMAATDFLQRIDDHLCHEKQQLVQQSRNN